MRSLCRNLIGGLRRPGITSLRTHAAVTVSRRHVSVSREPLLESSRKFPGLADNTFWRQLEPVINFHISETQPRSSTSLNATALTLFERHDNSNVQTRNRFEALQLRDMCSCHRCRDPDSGQKNFATHDIPDTLTIHSCNVESGELQLEWNNDVAGFNGHHTRLNLKKLMKLSRISSSFKNPTEIANPMIPWRAKEMNDARTNGSNFAEFNPFLTDQDTFQRIAHQLWTSGLVFITGVPRDEQSVITLAEKIGPLRDSFYGRTWDVKDKPKAENVAYTSKYLGLHMDLLYMKQPPGLQLLHCLDASSTGGQSIFADTWKAAEELFATSPHLFEVLATFPVTYNYNKGGHWYRDHKPVLEIDHYRQELAQDTPFNDASRGKMPPLANVNWSPPFQGDFAIDFGARDAGTKFHLWCKAAKAFDGLLNSKKNMFLHRLAPGECVIFHNRRVVHGRESFESGSEARWLKGAYVDIDPLESVMRTQIRKKYAANEESRPSRHSVFSFTSFTRQRMMLDDDYFISTTGTLVSTPAKKKTQEN